MSPQNSDHCLPRKRGDTLNGGWLRNYSRLSHNQVGSVDLKQTTKYFSSKHRFIWNQQRTAIWGLQPWQPCVGSLITKEENSFTEEKGGWEGLVNKEFSAFHWLSPCQEKKEEVLFFLLCSATVRGCKSSPFWFFI